MDGKKEQKEAFKSRKKIEGKYCGIKGAELKKF